MIAKRRRDVEIGALAHHVDELLEACAVDVELSNFVGRLLDLFCIGCAQMCVCVCVCVCRAPTHLLNNFELNAVDLLFARRDDYLQKLEENGVSSFVLD